MSCPTYLFFFVGCVGGHKNRSRRRGFPVEFLKAKVEAHVKQRNFLWNLVFPKGRVLRIKM